MKIPVILFLLCASVCGADTTTNVVGDITTKVFERTGKDGKPEQRIETIYRGKTKILQTLSRQNKQGTLAAYSRSYFVEGKTVMSEIEDDGNGGFKTLMLCLPGTDNFEIFQRQPDGSVKPVSTQTVEVTKKQGAIMEESLRKDFEKQNKQDMTDQEISDSLEQMRQKIQDLEKEKKGDE